MFSSLLFPDNSRVFARPGPGNGPICLFCKIKTKETKCPRLPGSRGYRINKLASNLSVMSTLQLGRPVRPGLVTRHGSEIGLEATLGLIKIINMPIYLLLLELAKNSHVSHHETVRRNRTLVLVGKLSPLFYWRSRWRIWRSMDVNTVTFMDHLRARNGWWGKVMSEAPWLGGHCVLKSGVER